MEDKRTSIAKTAIPPDEQTPQSQSPSMQSRLPPPKQPLTPYIPATQNSSKSQAQLLMELTAISGEYPADNIHRIIPSPSYAKKVVAALIADKMLKLVNKGNVRGYRLEIKAKRQLLAENHARYKDYMEGATDTNKLRSAHSRRLRLHSAAEVYTLMLGAGVRIFKDTKPKVYLLDEAANPSQTISGSSEGKTPLNTTNTSTQGNPSQSSVESSECKATIAITTPCFYSSREQKGEDDKAIRGSRAVGTLLTPTHVYAVYNTGNVESQWREGVEERYMEEVRNYICRRLLLAQYNGDAVGGILIGADFKILMDYLTAETKTGAARSFLTETYWPFYFITNDNYGTVQLRLLCDNATMTSLKTGMFKKYRPHDIKHPVEHDVLTEDGNPVLFCFLLDIPRLIKFRMGLLLREKIGRVIAFDFQETMLREYLGEEVEIKTLSLDAFMKMFYPN